MTRRDIVSFLRKPAFIRGISGRLRHWMHAVSRRTLWLLAVLPLFGALAATFTQINWSSGVPADATACGTVGGQWTGSECAAVDPTNQTGWTAYSSKDAAIVLANGGADLQLGTVSDSRTHTSDIDFALSKNVSRIHSSTVDFSRGAALSGVFVNGGTVKLAFATHTPSVVANSAWNTTSWIYNRNGSLANQIYRPALADLDDDGDYDMLVGGLDGRTYASINTGSSTAPA